MRFEFSVPGRIDRAVFLDMGDDRYIEVFGQGSTVRSEGRRRRPGEEPTEGAVLESRQSLSPVTIWSSFGSRHARPISDSEP